MLFSNSIKGGKRILLVLMALATLSGCFSPTKKDDETVRKNGKTVSSANFIVEKIEGFSVESHDLSKIWRLPRSRFFSFKVCLVSIATTQKIQGQKFRVENGSIIYRPSVTDNNGCLQWHETIPYPYFGNSKYLVFRRNIVAEGLYKGVREVEIAVNPWARLHNLDNEVVHIKSRNIDGSQSYIPEELLVEESDLVVKALQPGKEGQFPLWMDNLAIHVVKLGQLEKNEEPQSQIGPRKRPSEEVDKEEDIFGKVGDGVRLQMNINMSPKVLIDNMKGGYARKSLEAGQFRVFAQVVATDFGASGNEKLVLFPSKPSEIGMVDPHTGILSVPINVRLTRRTAEGTLRLAIRVVPMNGPESLKEYQGLYLLGEFDQIRGSKKPLYTPDHLQQGRVFNIDRYLEDTSNYKELVAAHRAFKQELYELDTLKINWLQVQPGETSTTRTIEYRAKTCVRDMVTGRKMKDLRFNIKRIRDSHLFPQHPVIPAVMEIMTDQDGCLAWVDEVTHKYYKPEDILFPTVEISRGGYKKVLGLGLNPWDDKFTFGFDVRDTPKEYVESIRSRDKIPSRFFVTGYHYETLRFRYNIDEYMNLNVKKTVSMTVAPEVLRYNSIVNGLKTTERLRDGIYLMKMALMKDYIDPTGPKQRIVFDAEYDDQKGHLGVLLPNYESKKRGAFVLKSGKDAMYRSFISSVSKLVLVQAGKIITPVQFSMRDLRLMRIRNQFLIQLETIDEKKLQVLSKVSKWLKGADRGLNFLEEDIKGRIKQKDLLKAKRRRVKLWETEGSEQEHLDVELEVLREIRELETSISKEKKKNALVLGALASRLGEYAYNGKRQIFTQMMVNNILTAPHFRPEREVIDDAEARGKKLTDIGVPFDVQDDIRKGLVKNDFTISPAAPVVELAKLLDTDSGLEKRTFIGPMTLLLNGNKSSMRPTDRLNIGVCETDDCSELDFSNPDLYGDALIDKQERLKMRQSRDIFVDNTRYKGSKYFGSITYLHNITVDELIENQKGLEAAYRKSMKYGSLIYDFVGRFGLTYVSLTDKPLEKFDRSNCKVIEDSKCLSKTREQTIPVEDFLNSFTSTEYKWHGKKNLVGMSDLKNMITGDVSVLKEKPQLISALCSTLAAELADKIYKRPKPNKSGKMKFMSYAEQSQKSWWRGLSYSARKKCMSAIDDAGPEAGVTFDRKLRIIKTGEYRYMGGKSMNINIVGNTTLSHTEGSSVGASASAGFGFVPGLISWAALGYASAAALPGGVLAIGAITFLADFSSRVMRVSWDNARNRQDQKAVTEQTFLVMQTAVLDIKVLEHEKCVVVNLSNSIKEELDLGDRIRRQKERGYDVSDLTSGYMLCSGEVNKEETAVRERYYYFTQHFTEGDMLDSGDLYNHPWLLMLRGARSFRLFIDSMQSFRDVVLTDIKMLKLWSRDAGKILTREAWPIDTLADTYRNVTPSFPGLYTILNETYEKATYPWGEDPEDSFVDTDLKKIGIGTIDLHKTEQRFQERLKKGLEPDKEEPKQQFIEVQGSASGFE